MTISETVAIASALVAMAALAFNILKDRRGEAITAQSVRDKLDYISGTSITKKGEASANLWSSSIGYPGASTDIYITRVEGW